MKIMMLHSQQVSWEICWLILLNKYGTERNFYKYMNKIGVIIDEITIMSHILSERG